MREALTELEENVNILRRDVNRLTMTVILTIPVLVTVVILLLVEWANA